MALNGTREGLFNAALALVPEEVRGQRPVVLIPNPFYQVYAVAAQAVGAEPVFVPATAETGFLPDFAALPKDILNRTAIAYLCSPSNPQGAIAREDWAGLIALAEKYDFRIFADECYAEIYRDTPPPGRAGSGRRGRRRSRTGADLPFAVETLEPAGPALRLRRRRPREPRPDQAAARLCRRARCRCRCNGWPSGPGPTRRMWPRAARSTRKNTRIADEVFAGVDGLRRRRRPGSSSGCRSTTANRRR